MARPSKYAVALAAVIGCAALLGACKQGGSATPMPQPGSSTPASSAQAPSTQTSRELPYGDAPRVANPLPSTVLDQPPCTSALTDAQLRELFRTSPAPTPGDNAVGSTCEWSNVETGAGMLVSYHTKQRLGLSATYENTRPKVRFWQVAPDVQGFPAVYYELSRATPKDGCSISVGVADDLSFFVAVNISRSKIGQVNPCDSARVVADMVVTNLKRVS